MPTYPKWAPPGLKDTLSQDRANLPPHFVTLIESLLTDDNMRKVWENMEKSPNKPSDWDIKFAGLVSRTLGRYHRERLEPAKRTRLIEKTVKLIDQLIAATDDLDLGLDDVFWESLIQLQVQQIGWLLLKQEEDTLRSILDYPAICCLNIKAALQALRERVERERAAPQLLSKPRDKSADLNFFLYTLDDACKTGKLNITHEGLGIVARIALNCPDDVSSETVKDILKRRRATLNKSSKGGAFPPIPAEISSRTGKILPSK